VGLVAQLPEEPEVYGVYKARVSSVMDFGCFCELLGFRKKFEGLVHVSSMRAGATNARNIASRGEQVFVKVRTDPGGNLRPNSLFVTISAVESKKLTHAFAR
jgi:polyribonucleotide nucleotidyltransferase